MTEPAPPPTLAEARAERDIARVRVSNTLTRTRRRLNPRVVVHDAVDHAGERAKATAGRIADAARRRPETVVAAAGLLIAFLARHRIARLVLGKAAAEPVMTPDALPRIVPATRQDSAADATAAIAASLNENRARRPVKGPLT